MSLSPKRANVSRLAWPDWALSVLAISQLGAFDRRQVPGWRKEVSDLPTGAEDGKEPTSPA